MTDEVQRLRERAAVLRREALTAEQTMIIERRRKKEKRDAEADRTIDVLLQTSLSSSDKQLPTAQDLAARLREDRISMDALIKVVERLHEYETAGMAGPRGYLSREKEGFVLGDSENNAFENTHIESDRISGLLDRILDAVTLIDEEGNSSTLLASVLRTRVSDLRSSRDATFHRMMETLLARGDGTKGNENDEIEGYARQSSVGDDQRVFDDATRQWKRRAVEDEAEPSSRRLVETPPWLPSYLAAYATTSTIDIPASHWTLLRTKLLADSGFVCTSWDFANTSVVFRGRWEYSRKDGGTRVVLGRADANNVEGRTIAVAFAKLQDRLKNHTQLKDSVRLFLVSDNEWQSVYESFSVGGAVGNQRLRRDVREGKSPPSVIIAMAKDVSPVQERSPVNRALAAVSTLLTVFTTLTYALGAYALNPTFFHTIVNENNVAAVPTCLPIFVAVLALSAIHELGHAVVARRYGVKLGVPVPLPSLKVGTFGSITPLRSFPPTRVALFDVAIGGTGTSMLTSILLIVLGLSLTITSRSLENFPAVPAAVMKSSFLVGQLVTFVAPTIMLAPLSQPVPIHPFFLVGLAGLVMSAVNLLPIGRLDGGRACAATFGRRVSSLISFLSLVMLAYYSLIGVSGITAFWGSLLILARQRLPDVPCVDEVSGVGMLRTCVNVVGLFLALLTLIPFPGGAGPL